MKIHHANQTRRVKPKPQARHDLIEFCHFVDRDFKSPAHIRLLAEKLRQVERFIETGGREGCGRLILNMPPRHGKTQTASKRWPSYLVGRHNAWRIALVAYQHEIAADFSRANKHLIQDSEEYHALFPTVSLHPASTSVERWSLANRPLDDPTMVAVGIGGPLTGRGFDLIIIDDPIKNRQEADSQATRNTLKNFYKGTLRTRLEPGGAIIIICTRWHEDDLAGWLLDQQTVREDKEYGDVYEVLNLPALAEPLDPLGRAPGEALWSERFPLLPDLRDIQNTISDYEWESQYQGKPVPPGGAVYQRAWWRGKNRYDPRDTTFLNACIARWLSFDTAFEDNEDDAFTACTVGELLPDYRLVIREVSRERLQFPDLQSEITDEARRYNVDGKLRGVIIERKASGTSAIQTLTQTAEDWLAQLIIGFSPSGSKEQRGKQASVWCRNGCVLIPMVSAAAPWLHDFEEELFNFPSSTYKDQVDSLSQLIIYLENLLSEGFRARGQVIP